jgi:hypothetical protein
MKKLSLLATIVVMAMVASCAAIPPEAVQLSMQVDSMIAQAKVAHLNTVEYHFDQLAIMVDRFAMNEYKTAFINNVLLIERKKDPNFVLTSAENDAIINKINNIKLAWLQDLWTNKATVMQSVTAFYSQLEEAHAAITNLLRSQSSLNASTLQAINNVSASFPTQTQQLNTQLINATNNTNNTLSGALQKVGP